jgi:hypothetical protein
MSSCMDVGLGMGDRHLGHQDSQTCHTTRFLLGFRQRSRLHTTHATVLAKATRTNPQLPNLMQQVKGAWEEFQYRLDIRHVTHKTHVGHL